MPTFLVAPIEMSRHTYMLIVNECFSDDQKHHLLIPGNILPLSDTQMVAVCSLAKHQMIFA